MTQDNEDLKNKVEGAALVAGGTAAGAGVAATVGGMGLVGGFGGVAIGMAPVAAAGAVVGSAAYGAKKAIEEGDATALGAVAAKDYILKTISTNIIKRFDNSCPRRPLSNFLCS